MCNNCNVALKIERLLMNVTQGLSKIKKWIALYIGAVSLILVPLYIKGSYFGLSTVLLLIIGLWSLLSSFLSENPIQSLTGSRGWNVGSLMTVVLILVTIIVSRHFQFSSYLLLPIIAVNLFINTLAVIQSAGVNAFGLQNGLIREQYYVYLTTIGNSNSYSERAGDGITVRSVCCTGIYGTHHGGERQQLCRDRHLPPLYPAFRVWFGTVCGTIPEAVSHSVGPVWRMSFICKVFPAV